MKSIADLLDEPATIDLPTAGAYLGIGRDASFQAGHRWIETQGREGIPCLRLGNRLRVPTAQLIRMLGIDLAETAGIDPAEVE